MRGVPGTGKSHTGRRLVGDQGFCMGADDWFDMQPGGYKANWKVESLFGAHKWNQSRVREGMKKGLGPIAVDNTNLRMKEARPYVEAAIQYQYWVEIRESDSPWWGEIVDLLKHRAANHAELMAWAKKLADGFEWEGAFIQNVHGVPEATILNMLERYNPYTLEDIKERIKFGVE